jgi:hypothetical protein
MFSRVLNCSQTTIGIRPSTPPGACQRDRPRHNRTRAACRVGEASRFASVSRRSKAGRFAYNLRARRYTHTPSVVVAAAARYFSLSRIAIVVFVTVSRLTSVQLTPSLTYQLLPSQSGQSSESGVRNRLTIGFRDCLMAPGGPSSTILAWSRKAIRVANRKAL